MVKMRTNNACRTTTDVFMLKLGQNADLTPRPACIQGVGKGRDAFNGHCGAVSLCVKCRAAKTSK